MTHGRKTLISLAQASVDYGISTKTLRRRIADGSINAYRLGPRLIKVNVDELDKLLVAIPTVAAAA